MHENVKYVQLSIHTSLHISQKFYKTKNEMHSLRYNIKKFAKMQNISRLAYFPEEFGVSGIDSVPLLESILQTSSALVCFCGTVRMRSYNGPLKLPMWLLR